MSSSDHDEFRLLITFSGADMVSPKWPICTPKLVFICYHMEDENGPILCIKVFLWLSGVLIRIQFISRNGLNDFCGDPDILEKVSQIVIKVEQGVTKCHEVFLTRI